MVDADRHATRPNHSVERAIEVLSLVSTKHATLSQLSEDLGVHKSTALRTLQTLEDAGFVRRDQFNRYSVGSKMIAIAFRTLEDIDIRNIAAEPLTELAQATDQAVHLAIRVDLDVVYIDKREAKSSVRMYSQLGRHLPIYCTSLGKAMLAFGSPALASDLMESMQFQPRTPTTIQSRDALEAELIVTRERGFGYDDGENEPTVHCIGAPIFGSSGTVDAAVSISVPRAFMTQEELFALAPGLLDTARRISRTLGSA